MTQPTMKSKLKIIIITFVATTAFWCLLIVCFFWWTFSEQGSGVSSEEGAASHGYYAMMRAWNAEKHSVTFTVAELRTNASNTATPPLVLLERLVPPSGEFCIGIKKTNALPSGK